MFIFHSDSCLELSFGKRKFVVTLMTSEHVNFTANQFSTQFMLITKKIVSLRWRIGNLTYCKTQPWAQPLIQLGFSQRQRLLKIVHKRRWPKNSKHAPEHSHFARICPGIQKIQYSLIWRHETSLFKLKFIHRLFQKIWNFEKIFAELGDTAPQSWKDSGKFRKISRS